MKELVTLDKKIERLEDNKVKFEITIDAAEVDEAIDEIYNEVRANTRIPGFRKGKAPRKVLESNFGAEYFTSYATANLIEKYSPAVVDEADMVALRDYEYDADETVTAGEDYTYSFTIQVKPQMELSSAEPVEVKMAPLAATDEEIDQQIDLLRSYYIDLKPVTDRPVQNDDIVVYSQECEVDGAAIEEGKEERRTYVVGGGSSNPEFDEQLIGMSIDETKDFVLQSSSLGLGDQYPMVPVTAKVTVHEITEKAIPELTDEWAKNSADVESVEALRAQVAESITAEKERGFERQKSLACLEALADRLEGEVPTEIVEDSTTKAMRNLYMSLQAEGYSLEQYLMATGQDINVFSEDMQKQGAQMAKQDMALDALARALELEVTEDDIVEAFADARDTDPEDLRAEWEAEHRMATLREEILRDKAAKWLYENAKIEFTAEAAAEAEEAPAEEAAEEAAPEAEEPAAEEAAE